MGRGGAEQALVYLLPALKARGFQCEVAALWPPYTLAPDLESAGVTVHRLDIHPRWNFIKAVRSIVRLVQHGHYDIIHAHVFFSAFYTALSKPFAPGSARVVTFHNLGYDSYPATNWKRKALKSVNKFLMRNFMDAYIAVSPAVAEHYGRHLGLSNIAVIPNAVHFQRSEELTQQHRKEILSRYGIDENRFVLLMAGRFVHEKGHRFLLDALRILGDREMRPQALMIGDGPLAENIGAAIKSQGLENRVKISNSVPHQELMEIMQAANAFVMASTHEGLPLAPAEAMLLSKPVIATAVGGLPDLIEPEISGLLVAARDPLALSNAIEKLMIDPELCAKLGSAGRQRVLSTFSLDTLLAHWEEFYGNLSSS